MGPVNTQIGLSQAFIGRKMEDGNVYFLGSHDGLTLHLWRTDGTTEGTIKIISESGIDEWKNILLTNAGAFIKIGNNLAFYKAGQLPVKNLGVFEDEHFVQVEEMDDQRFVFLTSQDTNANLVLTDRTATGTSLLGTVGNYSGFLKLYAGPYGAVVYNTNAFSTFVPKIWDAQSGQIMTVKDYLAPYKVVTKVNKVSMHDHYLFLEVAESGTKQYIFDLRTHTFYPGNNFFGIVEAFYPYGDDLLIISEREIARMDTTSFQIKEYTDEVFPLGTHFLTGDELYFHGYSTNDTVYIFQMDLATNKITRLPHGQIGKNYYNSRFEIHADELYYLRDFGPTTFLTRYDFADSVAVDIDSITVRNSSLVITNGLVEVKGNILVSKFTPEMWHELYYLDVMNGVETEKHLTLSVYPNPCQDLLYIDLPGQMGRVSISNVAGQVVLQEWVEDGFIKTASLPAGLYFGWMINADVRQGFSFVKRD